MKYLFFCKVEVSITIIYNIVVKMLQNSAQAADAGEANELNLLHAIIRYCVIMLSIIPMMVLYPFIQKYFVTGVMIGSIKG